MLADRNSSNESLRTDKSQIFSLNNDQPFNFKPIETNYYGITDINLLRYLNVPYKDKSQEQITYVKNYLKKKRFFHRYINLIGNYRFLD